MKVRSILAGLGLLASVSAFAAAWDLNAIFAEGSKLQTKLTNDGQMDYLLNPIYCLDTKAEQITLIFSQDFRHSEDAYLIVSGVAAKAKTSKLGLELQPTKGNGELSAMNVKYNGAQLLCVQSLMQLESVPLQIK